MKEAAVQYVNNQILVVSDRLRPYVQEGRTTHSRRPAFFRIKSHVERFLQGHREVRWIIIPGLRGVGKTTISAQIFFEFNRKVAAKHILYISVDDIVTAGLSLLDVLSAYEHVLGSHFESLRVPVILIIDEVQQDAQWAAVLKSVYDRARNVFVISTGSSAVHLQSSPDVARRGVYEKLYPLSFWEYRMLRSQIYPEKNLKQDLKLSFYDCASAKEVYERLLSLESRVNRAWKNVRKEDINEYLSTGTLPFTLRLASNDSYERISLLIDRMINKDIQELGKFDSQTVGIIKRLLFIMADGLDGLSVSKISTILGVQRPTLMSVLDALEKAEIIIRVSPYGSGMSAARKPSKYLFMSPAIRMSLLSITGLDQTFLARRGKLLEDVAGLHFYREFVAPGVGNVSYDTAESGADFILQIANKKQIAIEVGLGDKDFGQVRNTMNKATCHYGIVICSSEKLSFSQDDNIVKVPLKYFLLM